MIIFPIKMGKKKKSKKAKEKKSKQHLAAPSQVQAGDRTQEQSRNSYENLKSALAQAIREKKAYKVLPLAKELRKQPGFTPADNLLIVQAYELRISRMLAVSQHKEAEALFHTITESFPAYKPLFSMDFNLLLDLETGSRLLLARFDALDEKEQGQIELFIKNRLTNPASLARYPHLPPEHRLRQEAKLVLAAWEELEAETGAGAAFRELLGRVGRRSPLVCWRLFLQALAAFYAGRDDEAGAVLARIEPACAVQQGVRTLSALLAGKAPDTPAGKELAGKATVVSLAAELKELDAAVGQQRYNAAEGLAVQILKELSQAGKPGLRCMLGALYVFKLISEGMKIPDKLFKLADSTKFFAMALHWLHEENEEEFWTDYLREHKAGLSPLEKALLYQYLAKKRAAEKFSVYDEMLSFFTSGGREREPAQAAFTEAEELWKRAWLPAPWRRLMSNGTMKHSRSGKNNRRKASWKNGIPLSRQPTNRCYGWLNPCGNARCIRKRLNILHCSMN